MYVQCLIKLNQVLHTHHSSILKANIAGMKRHSCIGMLHSQSNYFPPFSSSVHLEALPFH